jgi:integrase
MWDSCPFIRSDQDWLFAWWEERKSPCITTRLALDWAQQTSARYPIKRLTMVRGFAKYLAGFDKRTEVPQRDCLARKFARSRPYIYSDEEIQHLLRAAWRYRRDKPRGTYYCLLGLLTVSGLRIGEAIRLQIQDVELNNGILTIRDTKFGKSRLVPIHPTTVKELRAYWNRRMNWKRYARLVPAVASCGLLLSSRFFDMLPLNCRHMLHRSSASWLSQGSVIHGL